VKVLPDNGRRRPLGDPGNGDGPAPGLFPRIGPATERALFLDLAQSERCVSAEDWGRESPTLIRHRLAPLALRASKQAGIDVETKRLLRDSAFGGVEYSRFVLARAAEPLRQLTAASVRFAVTKGPGIAAQYSVASERPYTDIDIVVAPGDFSRTMRLMRAMDFTEGAGKEAPWPYFGRWCVEAVNIEREDGSRLDIHHHVPPWFWGRRLDAATITDGARDQEVAAGVTLPVASSLHNLLIAALHIFSDHNSPGANLLAWRDVLVLLLAHEPEEVAATTARFGLDGWLRWILSSYPPCVDVEPYLRVLRGSQIEQIWRLRARSEHGGTSDGSLLYALRLPAPQAALYLGGTIVPSRRFIRSRSASSGGKYLEWWREGVRSPWR
jgi:Uncharacterised nucleotidyltransferase